MNEVATTNYANSGGELIMDVARMDSMFRMAEIMASGKSTLPQHFRGSPGDCMAVVMQSVTWKMNPFAVAQKTHVVNGTLGYESQLVHAVITSSGVLTKDDFDYEFFGPWEKVIGKFDIRKGDKGEYRVPGWALKDEDGCGVRIKATIRATGKEKVLEVLLAQARTRNSTLWADDPKQQLAYLGVKKWARLHTPGIILGVYTPDEFEQQAQTAQQTHHMGAAEVIAPEVPAALLAEAKAAAAAGVAAYGKFWTDTGKGNRQVLAGAHEEFKAAAIKADADRTIEQPTTVDAEFVADLDKSAA